MAKEFKTVTVAPEGEQYVIDTRGIFGWELQSSQEINSKESHIEGGFTGNYSVTTTENYVKLIFCRDPSQVENYSELVAIERQYDGLYNPGDEPFFSKIIFLALLLLYIFPGIIYYKSYKKKKKKYEEELTVFLNEREKLVEQAKQITYKKAIEA